MIVQWKEIVLLYIISALVVIFGLVVLSVIKYMENMSRYVEIFMQ